MKANILRERNEKIAELETHLKDASLKLGLYSRMRIKTEQTLTQAQSDVIGLQRERSGMAGDRDIKSKCNLAPRTYFIPPNLV